MKKISSFLTFLPLFLSCAAVISFLIIVIAVTAAPSSLLVTNFGVPLSGAIGLILVISALTCFLSLISGIISWVGYKYKRDRTKVGIAKKRIKIALLALFVAILIWVLMILLSDFR